MNFNQFTVEFAIRWAAVRQRFGVTGKYNWLYMGWQPPITRRAARRIARRSARLGTDVWGGAPGSPIVRSKVTGPRAGRVARRHVELALLICRDMLPQLTRLVDQAALTVPARPGAQAANN